MSNKVIDLDRLDRYDANLKTQANILQRNKAYILNQYVCRGNIFLKCIQAGTTDTTTLNLSGVVVGDELTDGTVKWLVIDHFGASGISNWQANKSYAVNDVVIYSNQIYQCNTAHTSGTNFDSTKWTKLSENTSLDTFGRVGDITYQYSILENHLPLDGSVISNFSVKYSELLQFFQSKSLIASTQADYDDNKALCYYDSSTDEMTMPDFLDKTIWGDTTIEEKEAGLPNIEGSITLHAPDTDGEIYSTSGAFSGMNERSKTGRYTNFVDAQCYSKVEFDASSSSSIYSDTVNTVQPPAIGLIPQIRYKADSLTDLTKIKDILYTGNSYNTSTTTVQTTNSMFNYDYLIIKLAYSTDGTNVLMNRTFAVVPVLGEVIDYSYFEATTSYIVIHGEVVDSTHYKFTVPELQGITNFKVVEIDGVVFAREASVFAKDWASNTSYKAGDLAIYGNGIYQCITDHTSISTFDDTKWKNLSIGYEKTNLYADTNFQTATTTVTTSSSMLAKDYLIIKMAYSSDGTNIDMNKSFYIMPSIGEVYDLSFIDSATSYAIIRGEIVDATHFKFTFKESVALTNYKSEIIGVSMGSGDSLATSVQIQSLF